MLARNWCVILILACSAAPYAEARLLHVTQKPLAGIAADSQVGTISQAATRLEPGDSVLIHGGVYREAVVIDKSGEPNKPIAIQAAEGEFVIITGADRLTDWSQAPGDQRVYSTPWPHKFVAWNKNQTHPDDEYHRLIGRCEQVFIDGYPLRQVLERSKLSRGTFFADTDAQLLYIQPAGNQEITP